jgi:hypothetical protein
MTVIEKALGQMETDKTGRTRNENPHASSALI